MSGRNPRSDRGLTPVVGIVLLVAITLLLASTVAAFAFGMEETQETQRVPTVAFDMSYEHDAGGDDTLEIIHRSGNAVDTARLAVDVSDATCAGGSGDPDGRYNVASDFGLSGELSAAETVTIDGSGPVACSGSGTLNLEGATVRVIWVPEAGTSSLLREWHGPG